MSARFTYKTGPVALPENCVSGKNYRFTFLTPSLVRLEYSPNGCFEDRASQSVFFRDFEKTDLSVSRNDGLLIVESENVRLAYQENAPFSAESLSLKLKIEPASEWKFGETFEDLGGTVRTLDEVNGSIPLGRGVCSRNGFSVLDDSDTMLLNDEGWVEVRQPQTVDCYFFGYGFHYLEAVKDFYRLTGAPPMLPAYALGNWWSRYHAYTQDEYQQLIERFEAEDVPLSVGVVDMDWHLTEIPEDCKDENPLFNRGWTGYTWNKELFPDYRAFLKFLKEHNLHTALNLHPACGVCAHEEMYPEMAAACGVDPSTKKRIPLDLLSPSYMGKYFDILHHPYENEGVDFWWMDWQQGKTYWWIHEENTEDHMQDPREVLDPLWMLNHLHISDIQRDGKRPMFFSRYSGPGSHRYPVGFSGDTFITWESLAFQPYFTATSSNIGYSWWSHDIGGHMGGSLDEELTVRWIQWGVFSPVNRLHSTISEYVRKEPWLFDDQSKAILTKWLQMRHRLFPYIYTMNRRNHSELEPFLQPMYYHYPKNNAAYEAKNQMFFGSELMIAPITSPKNEISCLGSAPVWFPIGHWFDFFNGLHYESRTGRKMTVHRPLDVMPVFAKAGAIVPMQNSMRLEPDTDLEVIVFPGADNTFTMYEDACEGNEFEKGEFAETTFSLKWSDAPTFTVSPAKGNRSLIPQERNWTFRLRGFAESVTAAVTVNGKAIKATASYDINTRTLSISLSAATDAEICININGETLITDNGDEMERCRHILMHAHCDGHAKARAEEVITGNKFTFNRRLSELNHACGTGRNYFGLVSALREQLTLFTDESENNEIVFHKF